MNDGEGLAVPEAESHRTELLRECVLGALRGYLDSMGNHEIHGLYRLVMNEVEQPLIEAVLEHTRGNQSAAAAILGISRGTLRKKLAQRAAAP